MFLSDSQKQYYAALKKLGKKKPQKLIERPGHPVQAILYDISMSRHLEIAIFVLIFLNIVNMGIEHYGQSAQVTYVLVMSNHLFTFIFSLGESSYVSGDLNITQHLLRGFTEDYWTTTSLL